MLNHESSPDLLVSRVAEAIRTLREQRGASVSQLAAQAGVPKSTLVQLEAGRAKPSIETLWAVARALGVPFSRLIEPPEPDVQVLRAGQGVQVGAADATFQARLLVSARRRGAFELYTIDIDPGSPRLAEAHTDGVVEHLIVLCGTVRVGLLDRSEVLEPGDLMTFRADVPHSYESIDGTARALLAMDYP
jgi:transcriptional regulator with XRE-family HTH domain